MDGTSDHYQGFQLPNCVVLISTAQLHPEDTLLIFLTFLTP